MDVIEQWIGVVTNPLGLAGFALFLVFTVIAKMGFSKGQSWLVASAFFMAFIALVGGLLLAWHETEVKQESDSTTQVNPGNGRASTSNTQTTTGDSSPAIQNVDGDITITITPDHEKSSD